MTDLLVPGDGTEPPDALHDARSVLSGGSSVELENVFVDGCHAVDIAIENGYGHIRCRECSYLWAGSWP